MASSYGKGKYGSRLYSLAPIVDLAGDLTPFIGFSGRLDVLVAQGDLAGDLRPLIVLSASLDGRSCVPGRSGSSDCFDRIVDLWTVMEALCARRAALGSV